MRLLSMEARVDASRLKNASRLQESDWKHLQRAAGEMHDAQLYLDDTPALNLLEIKARARRIKSQHGLGLVTLPGMAVFLLILLCTLPVIALIRWNPKGFLRRTGIARDYLRKWKTPEWLVWPTLLCGAFHVFEVEIVSDVARNALIPIVLIYFFHGMSILAFFLDSLRLRGPFRVLFYGAAIVFLTPMVVSFGFFDLWFSFRSRNRPSDRSDDKSDDFDNEEKEP